MLRFKGPELVALQGSVSAVLLRAIRALLRAIGGAFCGKELYRGMSHAEQDIVLQRQDLRCE